MGDIDLLLNNSLNSYYKQLGNTGYVQDSQVKQLLLLEFMSDFVGKFEKYLTQDDYDVFNKIVNCLCSNNCFVTWDGCSFNVLNT